jgi:hypothetical protein
VENLPSEVEVLEFMEKENYKATMDEFSTNQEELDSWLHQRAQELLAKNQVQEAWKLLLSVKY